jgi:hypothetical protein
MLAPSTGPFELTGLAAQKKTQKNKSDKSQKDKVVDESEGRPILWKEQADIESLDLLYGPGGKEGAPDLNGRFTYLKTDSGGTQKKIRVKDDQGREWTVKFGPEARPETSASRFVWAAGYHTDEDYFVKKARIDGMPGGGEAKNVRFERRHDGLKTVGLWSWASNPFVGTRELDGLKVLMVLMNNWDLKTVNNKVVRPTRKSGEDTDERIYYVGDLGATFGKTGSFARGLLPGDPPAGSKGKPKDYAKQDFIDGVRDGVVLFHYKGKDPAALKGIRVENAKWMGDILRRLSDKQLSDAFRAGGYDDSETAILARAMRERINELQSLR